MDTYVCNEILHGDFDIVELDKGCPTACCASGRDSAHCDARMAFQGHDEERDTTWSWASSTNCHCRVIGPDAIRNP